VSSEDDLQGLVAGVVARSKRPLSATTVRSALPEPQRPSAARVRDALAALVREGRLFAVRVGGRDAYSTRDLAAEVDRAIRDALAEGPLSRSALDERVSKRAPGIARGLRRRAVEGLLERGELFRHPPIGRFRDRIGLAPPDPALYVAGSVAALRKVERSLRACGVGEDAWRAAIAAALGLAAGAPAGGDADDEASLLAAVRDLTAQEGEGALVSIRRVRAMRSLDKGRFDRAMLRLQSARKVTMHHHDFPGSLSPEERGGLVEDGRGVFYVGVTLRGAE
jgi:hypothetical protein